MSRTWTRSLLSMALAAGLLGATAASSAAEENEWDEHKGMADQSGHGPGESTADMTREVGDPATDPHAGHTQTTHEPGESTADMTKDTGDPADDPHIQHNPQTHSPE